jgi:hypothetical protein
VRAGKCTKALTAAPGNSNASVCKHAHDLVSPVPAGYPQRRCANQAGRLGLRACRGSPLRDISIGPCKDVAGKAKVTMECKAAELANDCTFHQACSSTWQVRVLFLTVSPYHGADAQLQHRSGT